MIIVRAPLRITLGGGGTDLPGWYREHGGFLISASINKYIYLTGSKRPFDEKIWLSYSDVEICDAVDEIKHDIFAQCLKKFYKNGGIEIHSISEVTGGSGLGSSGTFTVALLKLLHKLDNTDITTQKLAELACHIEMIELKGSCGKQDQYIAAHGGIVSMEINKSGAVEIKRLDLDPLVLRRLQSNLLIYHTGVSRKASEVLRDQNENISSGKLSYHDGMKQIQEIGYSSLDCLVNGGLD
ncbi:galactokinase, partial [bacterium]|nr:galactokinase [bacterium]